MIEGLSTRATYLINKPEGVDVDFKAQLQGLSSEDLVAFANSPTGGAILIGVSEEVMPDGSQRGNVTGCLIGDGEKLSILNKASQCIPAIDIEIFFEKAEDVTFIRIEIPTGSRKPYCTAKGTYKIRGDGRNLPLTPERLLAIFLTEEGESFLRKFRTATELLDEDLQNILQRTSELDTKLEHTFDRADNASALADDAMMLSDETLGLTMEMERELSDIYGLSQLLAMRVDALLKHHNIEDPLLAQTRESIKFRVHKLHTSGVSLQDIIDAIHEDHIFNRYLTWVEIDELIRAELARQTNEKRDGRDSKNH